MASIANSIHKRRRAVALERSVVTAGWTLQRLDQLAHRMGHALWVDAVNPQWLDRLARPLGQLERENVELCHRMHQ
ncbi:hypothetical protein PI124_g15045 [Phytophthora idaei]|nr:hypothetical protein PI126_g13808 [Phytophthora idaei]KAG3240039.1 hypothetical protein PI124_g15045 [Phytophthora idaei]